MMCKLEYLLGISGKCLFVKGFRLAPYFLFLFHLIRFSSKLVSVTHFKASREACLVVESYVLLNGELQLNFVGNFNSRQIQVKVFSSIETKLYDGVN